MLEFVIYFVFMLSVAFTAGSVVISTRLRSKYKYGFLSTLMYFQVFIYTFGFYGIWGQVLISSVMKDYLSEAVLTRLSDITILPGLPFLVFAWMMFLKFSREITGKQNGQLKDTVFIVINFTIILTIIYIANKYPDIITKTILKYYFISLNSIYCLAGSLNILTSEKKKSSPVIINRKFITAILIFAMLTQDILLYFYTNDTYLGLGFVFCFFAGNTFLPLYLSYVASFIAPEETPMKEITLNHFNARFEISPREQDIIREIYNGLSNQEIAEKLFISLQTVKDHTHRIYVKTNVKSRVQLINLLREIIK
jgi:DNA-binding CsgD family transcriptional regulator